MDRKQPSAVRTPTINSIYQSVSTGNIIIHGYLPVAAHSSLMPSRPPVMTLHIQLSYSSLTARSVLIAILVALKPMRSIHAGRSRLNDDAADDECVQISVASGQRAAAADKPNSVAVIHMQSRRRRTSHKSTTPVGRRQPYNHPAPRPLHPRRAASALRARRYVNLSLRSTIETVHTAASCQTRGTFRTSPPFPGLRRFV